MTLDDGNVTTTNATGVYSFQAIAGQHTLTITKDGYATGTLPVSISPGSTTDVGDKVDDQLTIISYLGWIIAAIGVLVVGL